MYFVWSYRFDSFMFLTFFLLIWWQLNFVLNAGTFAALLYGKELNPVLVDILEYCSFKASALSKSDYAVIPCFDLEC